MLIIDCDVCKINTSSQILTLTFCVWSLFTTCNLFSKAGLHIYARAAARGKRVQVKTSFFSSLILLCVQVHACTSFYFRKRLLAKWRATDHNMNRSSLLILWDPKVNGHDHFLLLCVTSLLCCIQHYSFHSNILG